MTDLKSWRGPNAIPGHAQAKCQIYVIWGWDPWQRGNGDVCLWVGESARFWLLRVAEHADKYWRGDITRIEVVCDSRTGRPMHYGSKAEVWKAEEALTHQLLPIHSWEYNQNNPWVIRNMQGVNQRLPKVPAHWQASRSRSAAPTVATKAQPMGWLGKTAWAAAGWVCIAAAVWIAAATTAADQPVTARDGAGLGALAATMVYGGIWWAWVKLRTRKRR